MRADIARWKVTLSCYSHRLERLRGLVAALEAPADGLVDPQLLDCKRRLVLRYEDRIKHLYEGIRRCEDDLRFVRAAGAL